MQHYCFACPNKGPLIASASTQCTKCKRFYHRSCATRIGYVSKGVIKRCCREKTKTKTKIDNCTANRYRARNLSECSDSSSVHINNSSIITDNSGSHSINMAGGNTNRRSGSADRSHHDSQVQVSNPFEALWLKIEKKFDETIASIDKRFDDVYECIDEIRQDIAETSEKATLDAISEMSERKRRERFVIFRNVPEQDSDQLDTNFILGLLDVDGINLDLHNLKTFRLGILDKNHNKPRLLKVQFNSAQDAQWLIFNYKSLNFTDGIVCKSDQTFLQRNLIKKAVMELKTRESRGEKNLSLKFKNDVPFVATTSAPPANNNRNKGSNSKQKHK